MARDIRDDTGLWTVQLRVEKFVTLVEKYIFVDGAENYTSCYLYNDFQMA